MIILFKYIEWENLPNNLKNIKNPPLKLYYEGDIDLLNSLCFSVVGSRDLTDYGRRIEKKIVRDLCLRGITIVSRNGNWCRYSCA